MDIEKLVIPEVREPGTYVAEFVGIKRICLGLEIVWRLLEEPFQNAIMVEDVFDERDDEGRVSRRKRLGQRASVISGHDESPEINTGMYAGQRFRLTVVDKSDTLTKRIGLGKTLMVSKVEPLQKATRMVRPSLPLA